LNGGICGKIEGGKQCFCSQCFTGNLCEMKINGCENPCKNGGINIDDTCQCAAGFKDPTCSSCIFFFFFFFFFYWRNKKKKKKVIKCPEINDPTGNFVEGSSYQLVIGICSGGMNGNPTRQCLHDGKWRTVSSPCI